MAYFGKSYRIRSQLLIAAWLAKSTPQAVEVQPCRSAREPRGHCRAKLKALTDNLMIRFAVLEAEQQSESAAGLENENVSAHAVHRDTGNELSTLAMIGSATTVTGRHKASGEAGHDETSSRDKTVTLLLSGESTLMHDTTSHFST